MTSEETGWLIEKGKPGALEMIYFGEDEHGEFGWVDDSLKAIRFARREDAERFSKIGKKAGYGLVDLYDPHEIVEHGWYGEGK